MLNNAASENWTEKRQRALIGACLGFLDGSAFALCLALADVISYPSLPLGVDWGAFLFRWAWIGGGLALVGAISGWWNETWQGLVAGSVVAALVALVSALGASQSSLSLRVVTLVLLLMPITAVCLPLVILLRWLAVRHFRAWQERATFTWILLLLASLALGFLVGLPFRMSDRAAESVGYLVNLVQTVDTDTKNPLAEYQPIRQRQQMPYKMFLRESEKTTEGFDIRLDFEDGYSVECVIISYPGQKPHFSRCGP